MKDKTQELGDERNMIGRSSASQHSILMQFLMKCMMLSRSRYHNSWWGWLSFSYVDYGRQGLDYEPRKSVVSQVCTRKCWRADRTYIRIFAKAKTLDENALSPFEKMSILLTSHRIACEINVESIVICRSYSSLFSYSFFEYAALHWFSHLRCIQDYNMHWQSLLKRSNDDVSIQSFVDLFDDNHKTVFEKVETYIDDVDKLLFSIILLRKLLFRSSSYDNISETNFQNWKCILLLVIFFECDFLNFTQLILTQSRFVEHSKSIDAIALKNVMIQTSLTNHISIVRFFLIKRKCFSKRILILHMISIL